jgi:hypothetical protein
MSNEDWHGVEQNPHCLQAVLNGSRQQLERDLPFARQLLPDSPALPYHRRRNESKTVIHWGQRKLLLSEMEFLNMHGHLSNLVVYAGAAPGTHLNYLIDAFPDHRFVCVDPARFSIRPNARVELRNELFTDEMAREFERARCLFVCDIRSADSSADNADDVEVHVEEDMMAQQQWHKLMRPVKSLLKFRLPWNPGATSCPPPPIIAVPLLHRCFVTVSELNSMAIFAQVFGRRRLLSGFRAHHVYGNSADSLRRPQHEGLGQQEVCRPIVLFQHSSSACSVCAYPQHRASARLWT